MGGLAAWAQEGVVVRDRLPALAVYLGHVHPKGTYWYLTATPPVLEPADCGRGACRLLGTAKLIPAVATRLLFPVVPESRGSSTRPLAANYVYVL